MGCSKERILPCELSRLTWRHYIVHMYARPVYGVESDSGTPPQQPVNNEGTRRPDSNLARTCAGSRVCETEAEDRRRHSPDSAPNPVRAVQMVRGSVGSENASVSECALPRPLLVLCSCVYTKAGRRYLAYRRRGQRRDAMCRA